MTNTQLCLVILTNLVTAAMVILYIKVRIDRFKKALTKKLAKYLDIEDDEK